MNVFYFKPNLKYEVSLEGCTVPSVAVLPAFAVNVFFVFDKVQYLYRKIIDIVGFTTPSDFSFWADGTAFRSEYE